jgi:hypothetical protein
MYNLSMNVEHSFDLSVTAGFNQLILPQPVLVKKGSLIFLTQTLNSTNVAIDQSGTASYSDMIWGTNLQQLNATSNYRFFLAPISNFTKYQTNLIVAHAYKNIGLYNLSLTFLSSNKVFSRIINITDCKH